jgi:hypothetical protein
MDGLADTPACHALQRTLSAPIEAVFEAAFREFGVPQAIRIDNGAPFSTLAAGGCSRPGIQTTTGPTKPCRDETLASHYQRSQREVSDSRLQ